MINQIEKDEILYMITKKDLQHEAQLFIGRELNEDEYLKAKKLLEWGIGENLVFTYSNIFSEIKNE